MTCNQFIIKGHEYSHLHLQRTTSHLAAGLHLDPQGEILQTTSCTLVRKWLEKGRGKTGMISISYEQAQL